MPPRQRRADWCLSSGLRFWTGGFRVLAQRQLRGPHVTFRPGWRLAARTPVSIRGQQPCERTKPRSGTVGGGGARHGRLWATPRVQAASGTASHWRFRQAQRPLFRSREEDRTARGMPCSLPAEARQKHGESFHTKTAAKIRYQLQVAILSVGSCHGPAHRPPAPFVSS